MIIGLDANWAIYEEAGIGKYTYNLIKALLHEDKKNHYILYFNFFRKAEERKSIIHDLVKDSKASYDVNISTLPAAWKEFLSQTYLPLNYLYKEKVDVFHSPFFSGIPRVGFGKMAVTIHDLVFLKFPEHRGTKLSNYYLKRTKFALKNCQKIIAVSEATKNDLIELLKVDPNQIKVIHEGLNENFKDYRPKKNDLSLPSKYILSVCTLEPRKNLIRLIRAYSLLPNQIKNKYKLVLIGKNGWNNNELFQTINDLNLKGNIILPGYVEDSKLPDYYSNASVFVYPSLYEGFGLPPLEAMACGVPVITSNISSLPEVVAKAGLLVNPYQEEQISKGIRTILSSPGLQKKMVQKGKIQAHKFQWTKAAQKTIQIYEEIKNK